MLVSTIITNAFNIANIYNTNFFTTAEQLWHAQLAWEQVYAFLAENDDDYFITQKYITTQISTTGTTANGSATISAIPDTSILYVGAAISDSAGYIPAGSTILTIASGTSITISNQCTGVQVLDQLTIKNFAPDTNRQFTYNFTLPADFYRLRLLQYRGNTNAVAYFPCSKMNKQNYGSTQNAPAYSFMGNYLNIYDPVGYPTYCIWYYPKPATLTTSTDLALPSNMIPELMSYQIAVEMVRKEKNDPALYQAKVDELYRTMKMQNSRDDATALTPKNIFEGGYNTWA